MLKDFFKEYQTNGKPWLTCGKGPSFRSPTDLERSEYNIISLNHACRETKVDIAHVIDIDVIDQLGESLYDNAGILLCPYYPHLGWRPNPGITLDDISSRHPVLSRMRKEGRLYGYNLSTASQMINKKWNDSPIVWASFFSAEAVVSLLGKLGVKKIRTLGVDGGKGQASNFSDLQNINVNGYDAEWKGIRKSIQKFSLDYAPLGVESPVRIFIGAGDQQMVPALVLKHSILKHATMSVDVTIMNEWKHPMPKDGRNRPRTPFSFQRFMIPEKCGYKGHAIYMDSDMLVFGDVKEIWQAPMSTQALTMRFDDIDKHKAKYSVIKIDNDISQWTIDDVIYKLDSGLLTYEQLVFEYEIGPDVTEGYDPNWNSLEEYIKGETKLLHYTEMYNQPWLVNPNHPLGHLWFAELKESVEDGSIKKELVEEHVAKGWILPSCLEAIKNPEAGYTSGKSI